MRDRIVYFQRHCSHVAGSEILSGHFLSLFIHYEQDKILTDEILQA